MFVTAASSNHFKSLLQYIKSLEEKPVIVYNLGLTDAELDILKSLPITLRTFDWSTVPPWGRLTPETAGYYVWKPVIIATVMKEGHDTVIWCDAGNIITDAKSLIRVTKSTHIYTPFSSGVLSQWTHLKCLNGLKMTEIQRILPMRNAAIIGFDAKDPTAQTFVDDWKRYSLVEEWMVGDRSNHRHDQSIMTCLFYKYKRTSPAYCIGVETHKDCD